MTPRGERLRLTCGWSAIVISIAVAVASPAIGLGLFTIGASLVAATWYAKLQNERAASRPHSPRQARRGYRRDQAFEYRELFEAGIISREQYLNGVAKLYPELHRTAAPTHVR